MLGQTVAITLFSPVSFPFVITSFSPVSLSLCVLFYPLTLVGSSSKQLIAGAGGAGQTATHPYSTCDMRGS